MRTVNRAKHAVKTALLRAERAGLNLGVVPGTPYPAGRVDSIEAWAREHAGDGADLVHVGMPRYAPRAVARSLTPIDAPEIAPLDLHFRPVEPVVLTVAHGRLLGPDGAVVVDGDVLLETLWEDGQFEHGVPAARATRSPIRLAGTYASIVAPWSVNWFHWLFDTLPRLAVLRAHGLGDAPLIVPTRLTDAQRRTLELLGVGSGQRVPFSRRNVIVDELIWASSGSFAHYPVAWQAEWLRREIVAGVGAQPVRGRRLYVSRASVPVPRVPSNRQSRRAVSNEADVTAVLERHGFEAVQAEKFSFDEQVRMFASAEVIVGPHGAGLANSVFAENATVVEFFEPSWVMPSFLSLSGACGHDYWYLIGERSGPGDIAVPIDALEETLDLVLGDRS